MDKLKIKVTVSVIDFQNDPFSGGSPWGAICARGDLDANRPYGGGGYDTKITTHSKLVDKSLQTSIINGPTSQGQKPFQWSTSGLPDVHMGQPDLFDFEFETVSAAPTA